jgi:hypothetical protein
VKHCRRFIGSKCREGLESCHQNHAQQYANAAAAHKTSRTGILIPVVPKNNTFSGNQQANYYHKGLTALHINMALIWEIDGLLGCRLPVCACKHASQSLVWLGRQEMHSPHVSLPVTHFSDIVAREINS